MREDCTISKKVQSCKEILCGVKLAKNKCVKKLTSSCSTFSPRAVSDQKSERLTDRLGELVTGLIFMCYYCMHTYVDRGHLYSIYYVITGGGGRTSMKEGGRIR